MLNKMFYDDLMSVLSWDVFMAVSLCVSNKNISHLLFPDVKFQTLFPLWQWSVSRNKSSAVAIVLHLYSPAG